MERLAESDRAEVAERDERFTEELLEMSWHHSGLRCRERPTV